MKVFITGIAGLVGSTACLYYSKLGWDVVGIDNDMRGYLFGQDGSVSEVAHMLRAYPNVQIYERDLRRTDELKHLIDGSDIIIHAAAQPSHPYSVSDPLLDFSINAEGTLRLLELVRTECKDVVFIYCSTNKVYGENPHNPNFYTIVEEETRYEYKFVDGINEDCPLDYTIHTPFGVSKLAADLYTQEYGRIYGIKTGTFRMGCITGGLAQAVEVHNWLPYFMKMALTGQELRIFGYKGKQVRDLIHASDLVQVFHLFAENPRPGEVYNIGGQRENSVSLLEAIDEIEELTGKKITWSLYPKRLGDHLIYVTNMFKFKVHYPNYKPEYNLDRIFCDIHKELTKQ